MIQPEPLIATVDQGSTSTKGALVTPQGEILARASLPVSRQVRGASVEHDPAELAASVDAVLERLTSGQRVAAIGITCQRSTCLLWDRRSGEPLTSALSWQDRSQAPRVEALPPRAADLVRRTGLRLSPHYAAPKLALLLDRIANRHHPDEMVAGTLDAFLCRRLTGHDATEPGHAGRTLLYSLESGTWDSELCALFGISPTCLPEIRPSAGPRGAWRGIPVTALAGDQQAALLGHGGWRDGVTAAHFGTGAFVLASTGREPSEHPALLSAVLADLGNERRFQLEGPVNSAGSAADWACRLTGQSLEDWRTRPLEADRLPPVFPALAGAGAPWWRPDARGVVAGVELGTGPEELLAGVLAGVVMRVLDCVETLAEAGVAPRALRISGRLTRLQGLAGLLADAGQLAVEVAPEEEAGLLGIARLALVGLDGGEEPLFAPPRGVVRRRPEWDPDRARALRAAWRRFAPGALELGSRPRQTG